MSAMERERSSDEIRRDIERTRADMDETVDALENRLSPGQLLDQVWASMKGKGSGSGVASGIGDVVRDHPVPLALMGLGVAWLAAEKAGRGDRDVGEGTYARAEGRRGPYRGDAVADGAWEHDGMGDKLKDGASSAASAVKDAAETVGDKVSSAASSAKRKASDAASSVKEKASSMGDSEEDAQDAYGAHGSHADRGLREKAGDTLDDARSSVKHGARKAQNGFERVLHDQPLAMGAVSFGLGLAAGLAVPTTEWEDRTMGETADTLKHEVKETAVETGEKAARVARDAAGAARDEAERQGMGDDLTTKAKRVASAAKEAAEDRADREDLDAEGLKAEGKKATRRTRDTAKREMS